MTFIKPLITLLLLFATTQAQNCSQDGDSGTFTNIIIVTVKFQPTAPQADEIKKLHFTNSTIHTFSTAVCDAFPKLEELHANGLSLKEVDANALHKCTKLTHVSFADNDLTTLDTKLFVNNLYLVRVSLDNNVLLKKIDGHMFNPLMNLEELSVSRISLKDFPVHEFPELGQLQKLRMHSNDLTDLDEMELKRKFPNLTHVELNGNLFDCNRLRVMLNCLKSENIKPDSSDTMVTRNFTKLDGKYDCVTEEQRFAAFLDSTEINEDMDTLDNNLHSGFIAYVVFVVSDFVFFVIVIAFIIQMKK